MLFRLWIYAIAIGTLGALVFGLLATGVGSLWLGQVAGGFGGLAAGLLVTGVLYAIFSALSLILFGPRR